MATAIEMRCRWLYSLDPGMLKCRELIDPKHSVIFQEPKPAKGQLTFDKGIPIQ
jgi:hypothetical protein